MKDTIALIAATCFQPIADALNRIADALAHDKTQPVKDTAPATTAEASPEAPAEAPKRTRGPNKPKEAPAPETPASAPAAPEAPETPEGELNGNFEHDFKVIQGYVAPLVKAGRKQDILNHLQTLGVNKVAELPLDQFAGLLEFLKGLGDETV